MEKSQLIDLAKTTTVEEKSPVHCEDRHPYLVIYIGNNSGCRHKLNSGHMTIGRSPPADISIEYERISHIHCVIEWIGDTITIEDKGSTVHTLMLEE